MADDLEAFLQRAAQKRKKRPPAQIVVIEPTPAEPIVAEAVRPPLRSERPAPEPPSIGSEPVVAHVARHLDNRPFEQRAAQLGEEVGLADDKLEAHLQRVFEHDVGTMRGGAETAEASEAAQQVFLEELVDMFRTPANLRRAILLNEIMTPPEYRW